MPDPRARDVVLGYAGMNALVADLIVPGDASMYVMSVMETSRELIRHSYYRYEFATVAVTHSLVALEHVLAWRLTVHEPVQDLIGRAADAGLIPAGLAAELDRGRALRDKLTQDTVTSAALGLVSAITMVQAVFDAVSLLLHPPAAASVTAVETNGTQPEDRLPRLWEEHRRAPYPDGFRGIAILWACIGNLDKAVPLINSEYYACYFARFRTMARLAAARHIPTAT
ncbi:hypothetical protein [Streptomyces sp. NPDC003688]